MFPADVVHAVLSDIIGRRESPFLAPAFVEEVWSGKPISRSIKTADR